jgi:DHA1 family bicyclomycin/chloramphenicol resistance-like MFS transporter
LRRPLHPRALWHGYRTVLLRRDFLLLAAIPTLNFAAYFIYIASAPMFLAQLGVTTWGFAWLFVPMITGTVAGAMISGRAAGRLSPAQTIHIGYAFMFAGAIINALVAAYVPPGVPWHVLPMMILTVGSSLVMPSLTLILLDMFPTMRGMASSLQGFAQFAFSGFTSGTIAPLLASSLTMLAAGMLGFTCASYVFWRVYQRGTMRAHKGVSR